MSPDDVNAILSGAEKIVYANCEDENWSPFNWPYPVFVVWAVGNAQGVTDNGGFQFFFESNWPETPCYDVFIGAFREIGANEAADCFEKAVSLFPFENPQLDCDGRMEYMEVSRLLPQERTSEIDILGDRVVEISDETYAKLSDYVLNHRSYFPTLNEQS